MQAAIEASGGPWLLGDSMTLADISIMPTIVRMWDLGMDGDWDTAPAVAHWLEMVRARPAFDLTYYHGALLTQKYPELNLRGAGRALPAL
jgi:glutathione S-transferase